MHGVQIANPDGAGPAMLEAADVALEKAVTELARANSIHASASRDFESSRSVERKSLEDLEASETAVAGRSEAMSRLQKSVDSINSETSRIADRASALTEAISASSEQIFELRERLSALEGEEAARMKVWEELEAKRLQLAAEREVARSKWQDAAGGLREVTQRRQLLEERVERIDSELVGLDGDGASEHDPDRLAHAESLSRRATAVLEARVAELRERQATLRAENRDLLAELEHVRNDHDLCTSQITNARQRIGELDIKLTELRLHREAVIEAINRRAGQPLLFR